MQRQHTLSQQQGLEDPATGLPTRRGLLNALAQYPGALVAGSGGAGDTVTLYHGTSPEGLAAIQQTGHINSPAFFSPTKKAASEYAAGGPVVEVKVPKSSLKIDFDLPGAQLLGVADANGYAGNENWTVDDYLNAGHSVGTEHPVSIAGAKIHNQ
jgi:hypothetical protein